MSFLDSWTSALGSGAAQQTQQDQNNAAETEQVQKLRGLNALRGINWDDPSSIKSGINALQGLGLTDLAKAQVDLSQTRALNTANLPNIQETAALYKRGLDRDAAQQGASSEDLSPEQLQHAQQTMQAAGEALARVKAAPLEQRSAILDQEAQQFEAAGLDPRAIASVKQHLSDANFADESIDALTDHYASHAENFGNIAQGGEPSATPSRHPADMYGPGTDLAASYLNDPTLMDPRMRGYAEKYLGINVGPGVDTAANLTANQRTVAAAGPQAYASTTGTNIANLNTEPAVAKAVAEASARGAAAGSPMEIALPNGSTQKGIINYDEANKPYFVPIGQAPAASGGQAGPPIASPSIGGAAGQAGAARSSIDAATAFENYSDGYKLRKSNLDNLREAASDISTGPQAPFWGNVGQIAAEYGIKTPFAPTANQTAAYEEVRKMALSVAAQQMSQLGLPTTNQGTDIAAGTTPHEETSPLGIKRLTGVLEGNEDYINATRQAWETWKSQNHGYETYNQWLPGWMKLFDPRVFQSQYMDPAQQAAVRAAVGPKRYDAEAAAAKRLGYLGGS